MNLEALNITDDCSFKANENIYTAPLCLGGFSVLFEHRQKSIMQNHTNNYSQARWKAIATYVKMAIRMSIYFLV